MLKSSVEIKNLRKNTYIPLKSKPLFDVMLLSSVTLCYAPEKLLDPSSVSKTDDNSVAELLYTADHIVTERLPVPPHTCSREVPSLQFL